MNPTYHAALKEPFILVGTHVGPGFSYARQHAYSSKGRKSMPPLYHRPALCEEIATSLAKWLAPRDDDIVVRRQVTKA